METIQAHWVVGCVRSGTNFFASLFEDLVEVVYSDIEELRPLDMRKPILSKYKTFAFKINEDADNAEALSKMFPSFCFYHVVRDGREVSESIAFPNPKSIPVRHFPAVKEICKKKKCPRIAAGALIWKGYIENIEKGLGPFKEKTIVVYYDRLVASPETEIPRVFAHFNLSELQLQRMIAKVRVTPNQKVWKRWRKQKRKNFYKVKGVRELVNAYKVYE